MHGLLLAAICESLILGVCRGLETSRGTVESRAQTSEGKGFPEPTGRVVGDAPGTPVWWWSGLRDRPDGSDASGPEARFPTHSSDFSGGG